MSTARPPSSLAPALRPFVTRLVAYDAELGPPGTHRGLPSTTLTVVLATGAPLDVAWAGSPSSRGSHWSLVSGLHTAPAQIHHDGHQSGVQLALTLTGTRALLGMPAGALARELVDLPDVCPALRHLPEQLAAARDPTAQLRLVEAALLAALARRRPTPARPEVGRALAALRRGSHVAAVADETGWSRRHLGALVRAESGLTPKQFQRVARFERSRGLLAAAATGGGRLADVAHRAGYADQAHLAREWNALAGCPPSTWLREEFPYVQAVADGEDPGWAAPPTEEAP